MKGTKSWKHLTCKLPQNRHRALSIIREMQTRIAAVFLDNHNFHAEENGVFE